MRIFGLDITRSASKRAAKKDYPEQIWGLNENTAAGENVTEDSAMRIVTVYRCVKVLSETVSATPATLFEETEEGIKTPATNVDIYDLFKYQPNLAQTPAEFKGQMQAHAAMNGNAYAEIIFKGERIVSLEPFDDPRRMDVAKKPNGELVYKYWHQNGKPEVYRQDQIFHLRGLTTRGLKGVSPITELRELMGYQQAMQKHASKFFSNSARIGGVLKYPGKLTKTAIQNLRDSWQSQYGGQDNAHKTAILEQGMDYLNIAMTMQDAEFVLQEKLSEAQLAGAWRTPLHMIGNLEKATFSNIEHLSLEFITFTMLPWYTLWQEAVARCLMTLEQQKRFKLEFEYEVFLRGDALARANTSSIERQNGIINADEWRRRIGLNPIKKKGEVVGDKYWQPANMGVLGEKKPEIVPGQGDPKGTSTPPGEQPAGAQEQNKPGISTKMEPLEPVIRSVFARALRREDKNGSEMPEERLRRMLSADLEPLVESSLQIIGRMDKLPELEPIINLFVAGWMGRARQSPGEQRLQTEVEAFHGELMELSEPPSDKV